MKKYIIDVHLDMYTTIEAHADNLEDAKRFAISEAHMCDINHFGCCNEDACLVECEESARREITFDGRKYLVAEYDIMVDGESMHVTISDSDLEARLYDGDKHLYVSKEAQVLDERIAFYIEPEEWSLSDDEIIKTVEISFK